MLHGAADFGLRVLYRDDVLQSRNIFELPEGLCELRMAGPQTLQTIEVPGYQVVQFLGAGARSWIWQIRDDRTGQILAVKKIVRNEPADARYVEQAENEFAVAAQFDHPVLRKVYKLRKIRRIVRVREIHMFMEYCEGRSVQDARPGDILTTVRIFSEVAAGMTYMNQKGFVHADMKPNNIVVSPDGKVKIIDFGQSCPLGTIKQRIQGTPDFMAPEQVQRRPLDSRTDVYNFGAALYWTLTGKPVPTIMPRKDSMTFVNELTLVPPEQLNPAVPGPLSKLVVDCVEMQVAHRPASMAEVNSRLGLILHTLNRRAALGGGK